MRAKVYKVEVEGDDVTIFAELRPGVKVSAHIIIQKENKMLIHMSAADTIRMPILGSNQAELTFKTRE
jgi:hypothetical protein